MGLGVAGLIAAGMMISRFTDTAQRPPDFYVEVNDMTFEEAYELNRDLAVLLMKREHTMYSTLQCKRSIKKESLIRLKMTQSHKTRQTQYMLKWITAMAHQVQKTD